MRSLRLCGSFFNPTKLVWQTWDRGFTAMDAMLPAKLKVGASGDKLHNLAES